MPTINFFLGSKLIVFDTYVWKGWPTADNWYWEHSYWSAIWSIPMFVKLQPTGNVPTTEIPTAPPAVSAELNATITRIAGDVAAVKSDITELKETVSSLSGEVSSLLGQIGFLNTIVAVEVIVIVVLAVGLVYAVRKKS